MPCEFRPLKLLILEHEALARWGVAAELRSLGHRVIEAHSAFEAVSVIESGTPIDVVFCDLDIPATQSKLDLARWLCVHEPELPVLFTSVDSCALNDRSAAAIIVKPYEIEAVLEKIRRLIFLRQNEKSEQ